ncbi:hypothetical protein [Bdellovibrio sp. HCB337]|uniref:hypothetical protein n=1 Tax=Bdellovibrio sp. HCB337 TaxID=3394358 RepID=UPI0039A490E2
MRSLFLMLAMLLSTAVSHAAEVKSSSPWRFDIYPLNLELRYERDASQQLVDRRPLNFAVGVRRDSSTVLLEYSSFTEKTGNATLAIDREHTEYLVWWKENLINMEVVDFYITAGAGAYQEEVTTSLSGSANTTDSSGFQMMGGGSGGAQTMIADLVLINIEARLMIGKNFDPNPQASLLVRLGVEF